MGRSRRPLLRALLYPYSEIFQSGPGQSRLVLRFGLPSGWQVARPSDPDPPNAGRFAVLMPEWPCSVLPHSVQQATGIRIEPTAAWQGQPAPLWRGIPCSVGTARVYFVNQDGEQEGLPILVWLPERDPPGPRSEVVYLGGEFLTHYGVHLSLNYSSLRYRVETLPGHVRLDVSVPAGVLEIR